VIRYLVFKSRFHKKLVHLDDNMCCSYIERGHANLCKQTVLFIHGFECTSVEFLCVSPYFDEDKYHLVAIDLLNHGDSTVILKPVELEEMMSFIRKVHWFCLHLVL